MNYQKLIDKCRKYYRKKDLKNAYQYWCKIHDLLLNKLDSFDKYDEKNVNKCYQEFYNYMRQFTDDEVYDITDYGKELYYIENGYLEI